jgi:hypothetical protein
VFCFFFSVDFLFRAFAGLWEGLWCENAHLCKNNATELFRLLEKYKPETKAQKKLRLKAAAEAVVSASVALEPPSRFSFVLLHNMRRCHRSRAPLS